jgi:hypothetical protein
MPTILKFMLTGQDPWGNKAIVHTDNRETAERMVVSWEKSGFIDVKMIAPDERSGPHAKQAHPT